MASAVIRISLIHAKPDDTQTLTSDSVPASRRAAAAPDREGDAAEGGGEPVPLPCGQTGQQGGDQARHRGPVQGHGGGGADAARAWQSQAAGPLPGPTGGLEEGHRHPEDGGLHRGVRGRLGRAKCRVPGAECRELTTEI